jgi:Uma2 family endonuclease
VIFEVLSPSTEAFDRGDKFARYRKLASLSDYVLVAAEFVRVEHFVRQENGAWTMTEYNQLTDEVPLRPLDCALPLAEIYRRVSFPGGLLDA